MKFIKYCPDTILFNRLSFRQLRNGQPVKFKNILTAFSASSGHALRLFLKPHTDMRSATPRQPCRRKWRHHIRCMSVPYHSYQGGWRFTQRSQEMPLQMSEKWSRRKVIGCAGKKSLKSRMGYCRGRQGTLLARQRGFSSCCSLSDKALEGVHDLAGH